MSARTYIPVGNTPPEGLVSVIEFGETVQCSSYGGGWAKALPKAAFLAEYREVHQDELAAIEHRAGFFAIDDYFEPPVPGYTTGIRWNGWATPVFEKDQIERIAAQFGDITYDEKRDVFIADNGPTVEDDCRYEEFAGQTIIVDGTTKHVYPIGSGAWTWEEVASDE